jgi:hypothetical protein
MADGPPELRNLRGSMNRASLRSGMRLRSDGQRRERTPRAKTVRTCQQLLNGAEGLWSFLKIEGFDQPTTRLSVPCASE